MESVNYIRGSVCVRYVVQPRRRGAVGAGYSILMKRVGDLFTKKGCDIVVISSLGLE